MVIGVVGGWHRECQNCGGGPLKRLRCAFYSDARESLLGEVFLEELRCLRCGYVTVRSRGESGADLDGAMADFIKRSRVMQDS
jgi:hypothetical protein